MPAVKPDFICPNCGNPVPGDATACPECGSDETTGWADDAQLADAHSTLDNDEYLDLYSKEFGIKHKRGKYEIVVAVAAAILLAIWIFNIVSTKKLF
jgi:uncharacterized membrane protein YvbJ